jgi:hypothetical protein
MQYEPKYIDKLLPPPRVPNYIDINKRMKILDTGRLSLDIKEINALELLVKTMSAGKARFTSNVMAIVGEDVREAEIDAFGNKVKTIIPRYIDKIVKTHNTISQQALNGALLAWAYEANTCEPAPLYLQSGTNSIVFIESSGQQLSFSPGLYGFPNGQSSYTFLFIVSDTSTNSYTVTQEQLFPWLVVPFHTGGNYQLAIPLSTANLVVSKSSNQILTFIWAIQINLSSTVQSQNIYFLFCPGCNGWSNGGCPGAVYAFSGSTTYFSADQTTYFVNVNGVLYAVAIATDTSSNSYTPSSIAALYWLQTNVAANQPGAQMVGYINAVTPPNPPGSKPSYASVSWYNGFYLST